jgi:N-acetylmuramoyl-L-alanine amidase
MEKKLIQILPMLTLPLLVANCSISRPIETVFPQAFPSETGIQIQEESFYGIAGYQVAPFPEQEEKRNHYDDRPTGTPIELLVMHYTVGSFGKTLCQFTENKPDNRTSAHYVITEQEKDKEIPGGMIFSIVPERKRAWHAGISRWKGIDGLNQYSIGIENVNKGFTQKVDEDGKKYLEWYPFDKKQIAALGKLSKGIVERYNIHPTNVVGHADIAPTRKLDPGILFPWEELYTNYQVGAWLEVLERSQESIVKFNPKENLPNGISDSFFLTYLEKWGYDVDVKAGSQFPKNKSAIQAFQAHFSRNQAVSSREQASLPDGLIDPKDQLWIWGLNAKYKSRE